ncbi:hypothetical protein X801_06104 [Opisthorchis viverrini]|uniref:Uncharacterized protein n=1 Tax=Opisthorchis viverrini TaxID=6198 RepID=A0A1S8WUF4_OPIVI|nr:hypothetical protein X801_06104 [Opisthorchis viverrini]
MNHEENPSPSNQQLMTVTEGKMESRLPKLPTSPKFPPEKDFTLWSFRARPFLESVPTDQFGVFLVSLLDDDALCQVQVSGILLTSRPKILWSLLEELFRCVQLALMSLEKFWERKQLQGETVDQYVAVLREIAAKAFPNESPADRNSQILKRFPLGLTKDHLKAKFVRKPPLRLAVALTTARSCEALCPILPSLPVNVAAVSSSQARPDPPTPSLGYPGPQSRCQHCQRFGRHAQRCGHNPPIQRVERYKANIVFVRHVMRLNGYRIRLSQSVSALINDTTWTDAMLTGCNAESKGSDGQDGEEYSRAE